MNGFSFGTAALLAVLTSLQACTTPASAPGPAPSAAYDAGYNDGCESGKASQSIVVGRYKRDAQRFATDKPYADGWTTGYDKCTYAQMQLGATGGP